MEIVWIMTAADKVFMLESIRNALIRSWRHREHETRANADEVTIDVAIELISLPWFC